MNAMTTENKEITMTTHAVKRMKERAGLGRHAAKRLFAKAIYHGITIDQTCGCLNRYLASVKIKSQAGHIVFLYGEMLYIVHDPENDPVAITAYQVPAKVKKQALKLQEKKKRQIRAIA